MDQYVFDLVQGVAGISPVFDRAISNIATNPILKGALPMVIFWGLWFAEERRAEIRAQLVATLLAAAAALALGRFLALSLPFQLRPLHTPGTEFHLSFPVSPETLSGWSAFPSDHAAMFFALAACFWRIDRRLGLIALAHAFVAIAFARVFLGFHWPSDILGGAAVGLVAAWIVFPPVARCGHDTGLIARLRRREYLLYPALFLVTYQVATMMDALRALADAVGSALAF